jgi:hypothetical protein
MEQVLRCKYGCKEYRCKLNALNTLSRLHVSSPHQAYHYECQMASQTIIMLAMATTRAVQRVGPTRRAILTQSGLDGLVMIQLAAIRAKVAKNDKSSYGIARDARCKECKAERFALSAIWTIFLRVLLGIVRRKLQGKLIPTYRVLHNVNVVLEIRIREFQGKAVLTYRDHDNSAVLLGIVKRKFQAQTIMTHRGRNNHKVFPKIFMRILQSTAVQRYRVLDNLRVLLRIVIQILQGNAARRTSQWRGQSSTTRRELHKTAQPAI